MPLERAVAENQSERSGETGTVVMVSILVKLACERVIEVGVCRCDCVDGGHDGREDTRAVWCRVEALRRAIVGCEGLLDGCADFFADGHRRIN